MPQIVLQHHSYRFAEEVLNSRLLIKQEIETILTDPTLLVPELKRPRLNEELRVRFLEKNWESPPLVFEGETGEPMARMDFLKNRVGIEVEFGHASFIGIDLLKLQIGSFSGLNTIDVGVYVVTTIRFQKRMRKEFNQKWEGSLSYEKVVRYLPHLKSAIQIPILVCGLDLV